MNLVLSLIWRLIVISFALLIALLAAGFLIGFGLSSGIVTEFIGADPNSFFNDPDVEFAILTVAAFGIGLVASVELAGVAMIPVFLGILVTEMARWQGMVVQLVIGGVCGIFILLSELPANVTPQEGTIIVTLAASFVAAFFYWLIAGRGAGNWQQYLGSIGEQNPDRESGEDARK